MQERRHGTGTGHFRLASAGKAVFELSWKVKHARCAFRVGFFEITLCDLKDDLAVGTPTKCFTMIQSLTNIPVERIEKAIYLIRDEKVMLDRDLAVLYGVTTSALNQAVKRHSDRFPPDFMFRLTLEETQGVPSRSQSVILKRPF
jgi:hypothetical protein